MSDINMSFNYNGEVSYKYIVNGKIVEDRKKNSGLPGLFEILTRALAGYDISSEVPIMLDLVKDSYSGNSLLTRTVYLTSTRYYRNDDSDESWSTYYTAALLPEDLSADVSGDAYFLVLKSMTKSLAYIQIENSLVDDIKSGAQLVIEWRLYFSNGSSSTADQVTL